MTITRSLRLLILATCSMLHGTASALEQAAKPIPFDQIGTEAQKIYSGDGISIAPVPGGARMRAVFQQLEAEVSEDGLWIISTADESICAAVEVVRSGAKDAAMNSSSLAQACRDRMQVRAAGVGRAAESLVSMSVFPNRGVVAVNPDSATFTRCGMIEEYSVSMDGVRQDFILPERVPGTGRLVLALSLTGAKAECATFGARLVLGGSGRVLAYSKLRVTDANGNKLDARLEVADAASLRVVVDDGDAAYPVRIDPTFSDADWVSLNPGIAGANSAVRAIAVDSSGNVYIGGDFTFAGTVAANRIAKWNGSVWSALGSGVNNVVRALVASGSTIYVGGDFTSAGGLTANAIAKWNGSAWSTLAGGLTGTIPTTSVYALATNGTDVYAGGSFTTAGGVAAGNVARWNGSAWSALGSGTGSTVLALALSGSSVYAGGNFTTAGGSAAAYIARWNGTVWSALGSGMNASVNALTAVGTDLYAGGFFTTAGGVSAKYIAKYNGSVWSALGSGMDFYVSALAASGTDVYAGGDFTTAGGVAAARIAKWNGSSWSALGSGTNLFVVALAVSGTNVYAGSGFTNAGGVAVSRVAKWNGTFWSAMGTGMNDVVNAVALSGTNLYIGGNFTTVGGVAANRVARWDGSSWSALHVNGLSNTVRTLAVIGSDLYAGGDFTTAGTTPASYVAKWNGIAWSALGSGASNIVSALAASGTDIYATGGFATAGGVTVNYVAKWNGTVWSAMGSGLNSDGRALAVSGTSVYVGGNFTSAGSVSANRVAKWDGTSWSALGTGMNARIDALTVLGGNLYAGGTFATAGGITANRIARWDGSTWSALGSGMNGDVYSLASNGTDLFAGGTFTTAGGITASRIAKWDGSAWSALGSGLNSTVNSLAAGGGYLYAGGAFQAAGSTVSPYIIRANLAPILTADLTSLGLSIGSLSPAFSAGTTSYRTTVSPSVTSISIQPSSADAAATITVNGISVVSGSYSSPISLSLGSNTISIIVTSRDGLTTKTYTLNVRRGEAKAQIISPVNGSALVSTSPTFIWDQGAGVTSYYLFVGTWAGGADIYAGDQGTELYKTVTVPADKTIYVTLYSLISGAYQPAYFVFGAVPSAKAELISPMNGDTLSDGTLNLSWVGGVGTTRYIVWIGSAYGGYDLGAADAGTTTSRTFTVPQDGGPVYVTLWSLINGAYQGNNYWFNAADPVSGSRQARITSPANTSTLSSAMMNLVWDQGSSVTSCALWVGSTPNGYDLYSGLEGTNLAKSVPIPGDGRRIHVTLHSLISGAYQSNSYWFTAPTLPDGGAAQITSPANGSTLADATLPLTWSNAAGATQYYIFAGSTPGGYDLYSGSQGTTLNRTLSGMPVDGRVIYVTLYSWLNGAWKQSSAWFTTANTTGGNRRALISSPANGTALPGASTTFNWSGGVGATSYALWIGSSPGAYDLWSSAETLATTSRSVTLPTDGRKIHVTLYSFISGAWQGASYIYTAANVAPTKAAMTSPVNGTTFTSASQTFNWSASNAATMYALWIGRSPGAYDIYAGAEGTNTSRTVTTLPTDGTPVYVTLYSLINGAWQSNENIYSSWLQP